MTKGWNDMTNFKAAIIKMLQQTVANTLEINGKKKSYASKQIERAK